MVAKKALPSLDLSGISWVFVFPGEAHASRMIA
jgi:hypothetical protein